MKRAVIYARVSTVVQQVDRQLSELNEFASRERLNVVQVVSEKTSGTLPAAQRDGLRGILEMAENGDFEVLLLHEISRLGRNTIEVLKILDQLTQLKINVYISQFNQYTLTDNGKKNPLAEFIFTMLASLATMERETLVERIKSGMDEARRQGKSIGRPAGSTESHSQFLNKYPRATRLFKEGQSVRNVAAICSISTATARKIRKAMHQNGQLPSSDHTLNTSRA